MNIAFLSLSQTPPLSVPMRFFLTAPFFGIAAGLMLLFGDNAILSNRWSTDTLMVVHMLTLGVISMVMIGALQQLLPVLMGVVIPRSDMVSRVLHLLWTLGSGMLILGMAQHHSSLLQYGAVLLTVATLLFVGMLLFALFRSDSRHGTLTAIAGSVISLLLTVLLMLWILNSAGWITPVAHPLTNLHASWGVIGWFLVLLIGIGYQVVPMFQITPEFPPIIRRYLTPVMFVAMLVWSGAEFYQLVWPGWLALVVLLVGLTLFAGAVLRLQQQRKRRLSDVTFNYWRVSMVALLVSAGVWLVGYLLGDSRWMESAVVIFLMGGILSAVSGMLFKIVPFLVWLHLNNLYQSQGEWQGKVPNVRQVIPERYSRWQFRVQMAALAILVLIPLESVIDGGERCITQAAGAAWVISFTMMLLILLYAGSKYKRAIGELAKSKSA